MVIIVRCVIGILIEIYQFNRIETAEIDSNMYRHTDKQFSIKMQREEGRNCLFQQLSLEQLDIHIQKINFNPYLKLYKVVTENGLYICKTKSVNLLKNIGKHIYSLWLVKNFLDIIKKPNPLIKISMNWSSFKLRSSALERYC